MELIGHTDNPCGDAFNLALSRQRATAVANALAIGVSMPADWARAAWAGRNRGQATRQLQGAPATGAWS